MIGIQVRDDLITACVCGRYGDVKPLIKAGADVDMIDDMGLTPLMRVATSPSRDRDETHDIAMTAQALIEAGADVEARDSSYIGGTALHWCTGVYGPAVAYRLIEAGADVDACSDRDGYTPLHTARFPALASLLLDSGASIEARDKDGMTPLGLALTCRPVDVCRVLIEYGAMIPPDYARRLSYSGWLQRRGVDVQGAELRARTALERDIDTIIAADPGRVDRTPSAGPWACL